MSDGIKSGKIEVSEELWEKLKDDPFPRHLGVDIMEVRPGYARVGLKVAHFMTNIHRITHGGVVFTLADVALGNACNSWGDSEVAMNVSIYYLKASRPGEYLMATAMAENMTRRTGLYRIKVENEKGELVATADGLVYRIPESGVEKRMS
ncbi:MAG: hotdog fold thioesterase [Firmicutes bacterium]|nr:hotdog fold thioesterase [Bacillota bacterium]